MAKKDAYYFSHDANARNDVKCLKLRREMGLEGYGIFWALIEMLREDDEHKLPVSLIEDIAFNLHTSKEKIEAVIRRYELFEVDSDFFFSQRLVRSMDEYKQLKNRLSEGGRKGSQNKALARLELPPSIKGKESKEKEIKEKEKKVFTPPTKDEVGLFVEQEYNWDELSARGFGYKFTSYYESTGWKRNKTPVKDWKATVRNWMLKEPQPLPVKKHDPSNKW